MTQTTPKDQPPLHLSATQSDKFLKFKHDGDHIFKIEHLPVALEMLDIEMQREREVKKRAKEEILKTKQFTIKEKYTSAFQFEDNDCETDHEIGFLH